MIKENVFQAKLVKELRAMGYLVLKNDSGHIQGIPDLLVLFKNRWAALECKRSKDSPRRPNQEHYIYELGKMSYASFIYPENKEDVLSELQKALGA